MFKKVKGKKDVEVTKGSNEEKEITPLLNNEKLDQAKKNIKEKKENILLKNKKFYVIAVLIILIISLITFGIITYMKTLKYKPYIKYEEKMKTYGFDTMYNNKTAKTSESVTQAEALKIALGAVFNTNDISGFAAENTEYENAVWVGYANYTKITKEDINIKNFNNKAKYIDVISYLENCKITFLKDQPIKDTAVNLKDISKYTPEQQTAIKDMITNEIIILNSSKLNGNDEIFKGQLNELVVNFVEKYNTITMSGDKVNVNPEKIPANVDQYPYTLSTVDKSVYEVPLDIQYSVDMTTAKNIYSYEKVYYPQIKTYTEAFFDGILNINYKTITEESFKQKIEPYLLFSPNESAIKNYVKYVKDNEIVIEGKSALQVPIIYFDGLSYRARIKLTFEIKNSKTKENLLYLDIFDGLKKTYEKTSYDILSDYYLSNQLENNNTYLNENELYNSLLNKETCGITKEVEKNINSTEEVK